MTIIRDHVAQTEEEKTRLAALTRLALLALAGRNYSSLSPALNVGEKRSLELRPRGRAARAKAKIRRTFAPIRLRLRRPESHSKE